MQSLLFHCERYQSFALNVGLLIMRLFFGLTMAFAHGFGKIPPPDALVGFIASKSIPFPGLMAWAASLAEFGGGIFIALGLATRLSTIPWIVTMMVAAFVAHGADPFAKKELALSYLIVGVILFLTGPGRFSIDALIVKKK